MNLSESGNRLQEEQQEQCRADDDENFNFNDYLINGNNINDLEYLLDDIDSHQHEREAAEEEANADSNGHEQPLGNDRDETEVESGDDIDEQDDDEPFEENAEGHYELEDVADIARPPDNGGDGESLPSRSYEGAEGPSSQESLPSQAELDEWVASKLEQLKKRIATTESNLNKTREKITADHQAITNKQEEYDREWAARNKGEHELQQILDTKQKIETQLKKRENDVEKAQEKLRFLVEEESELNSQPLEIYRKDIKNMKRKRKTRKYTQAQQGPTENLDEGDDSLSEKEGPDRRASSKKMRKNVPNACRRCKATKVRCDMKRGSCTTCTDAGKRCRYNDPWDSNRQLRPYQLLETEEKLAEAEEKIAFYEQLSMTSLLMDNPLSGITGYGPRPAQEARQNYARIIRGLDPMIRPLAVMASADTTKARDTTDAQHNKRSERARRNPPANLVSAPVPASALVPVPDPTPSLAPPEPKMQLGSYWIHHDKPPQNPVKRGRKPGQKSTKPRSDKGKPKTQTKPQQFPPPSSSREINTPASDQYIAVNNPKQKKSLLHTAAIAINPRQLWWANKIYSAGGQLPCQLDGNTYKIIWPTWTVQLNQKQLLWFDYMQSTGQEITSTEITTALEEQEPCWPGWASVNETLSEQQIKFLIQLLTAGINIIENINQDGTGQGTVNWTSRYVQES